MSSSSREKHQEPSAKHQGSTTDAAKEAKKKPKGQEGKRTGRVTTDKEGRARAATDGRTTRGIVNVQKVAEAHDIWWMGGKNYYMRSPAARFGRAVKEGADDAGLLKEGRFMELNDKRLTRWLQQMGLMRGDTNKPGEVEEMMSYLEACRQVDGVLNIAGHRDGVIRMPGGQMVLVEQGPELPEPKEGDWSLLRNLLEQALDRRLDSDAPPVGWRVHVKGDAVKKGMDVWQALTEKRVLPDDDGKESWWYRGTLPFYAWLKLRLELLWRRVRGGEDDFRRNGPVLVLTGPPDAYKSFIGEMVLSPLFGGRTADPTRYLSGATNFNKDLVGAELLVMGDSPLSTSMKDRKQLGEYFKNAVGQISQRLEMKGVDAYGRVQPVWSYLWTINDDKNNLQQLPPMVEGVVDKFLLLHMNSVTLLDADGNPIRTDDLDSYMAFGRRILAQVPAFMHYLLKEFTIPAALQGGRWGMVAVQAPEIMAEMFEDSSEGQFLDFLDVARFDHLGERKTLWQMADTRTKESSEWGQVEMDAERGRRRWMGTLHDLKTLLTSETCNVREEITEMFKRGRLDMVLARLAKQQSDRVGRPGKNADGRLHRGATVMRYWWIWEREGV